MRWRNLHAATKGTESLLSQQQDLGTASCCFTLALPRHSVKYSRVLSLTVGLADSASCPGSDREGCVVSLYVIHWYQLSALLISLEDRWTKWIPLKLHLIISQWQPGKNSACPLEAAELLVQVGRHCSTLNISVVEHSHFSSQHFMSWPSTEQP